MKKINWIRFGGIVNSGAIEKIKSGYWVRNNIDDDVVEKYAETPFIAWKIYHKIQEGNE